MDKQRAKEITESPIMVNVTYNGVPIYIQQVDEQNNTAKIYPLDHPENHQQVSLTGLKEH